MIFHAFSDNFLSNRYILVGKCYQLVLSWSLAVFFFCVRSDLGPFLSVFCVSPRFITPYWPGNSDFGVFALGASGSDFGQAQRRSPSQATHIFHLDGVFYLLLHRHKIQGTTVYCPIRRTQRAPAGSIDVLGLKVRFWNRA
jgi:hypothetical protein